MRRRLVISTLAIVLVVLAALAIPVGVIVQQSADARLEQEQSATLDRLVEQIDAVTATGDEPELSDVSSLLDASDGVVVRGPRPEREVVFRSSASVTGSTREATRTTADDYEVTLISDQDPFNEDLRGRLVVLIALAIGALLAAAGLAAVQSHQLARPLERLAARAARIGEGDFSTQPFVPTRIPEIDHIGAALDSSSQRVDTMLANERHFTADATHQLRTGIAGIAMRLEILSMNSDPTVAEEAAAGLDQTDQLNATIDELLAAARNRSTTERSVFDLTELVNDHALEWQARFHAVRRHVSVITANEPPPVFGTKGLAGQVLDILIDNSLRHGAGAVTLMIDGPSVVVIDQGPGVPAQKLKTLFDGPVDPAARHGRGLPLARRLAQVDGATLDVVGNHPLRLRFQLVTGDQAPNELAASST